MNLIQKKSLLMALGIAMTITALMMYYLQLQTVTARDLQTVVLALTDIEANTIINHEHIREVYIPRKLIIPGSISSIDQVVGKTASENIFKGEQIINNRLVQQKVTDRFSSIIPQGYRAVTIKIDPSTGVGGFIKNNDYIDILVYLSPPYTEKESVKTMFQMVKVLDTSFKGITSSHGTYFLTLCMKPEDIEQFFLLTQVGTIKIVLRNTADKKTPVLSITEIEVVW